ncbi:major facilitator superfamily domain-containing protein [Aspergillus pseudocaelatus]|uniref:Major facilitator superfamily domain-containing protein n=1 Tax=Aspergillus pseudocaelatus TaxID=1825620 RepID=A0ABQ6WYZ1_9EURO|nr:major facilitator superfamily domain-containing protein [Aspergillus pseudocaelatus]
MRGSNGQHELCQVSFSSPTHPEFSLGKRGVLIFLTLSILTMMVALDGTSISVALPIISRDLHGTAIEAFWAGTSFLLCSTVFQPTFASFSNIFGRRLMVLAAIMFFFAGTVVAGVAHSFRELLVGRSVQGVGGGGIIALSEVIVTDIVPLRLRGQYFGILSAMWSVGSVTGPILGGGFAQNVDWRWVFYINFPFIGVAVVLVFLFLRLERVQTSFRTKLRQIDYVGTVLFTGSVSSFLIPLTWGGVVYPWGSWHTLTPLLIGFVGLLVFAAFEYYIAKDPIIPPTIFNNRTASITFIGTTLQGLVLWCALYYLPLYYETVKEFNPILTGIALFPETFTVAPCAVLTGVFISVTGRYRGAICLGWTLSTLGTGLLCLMKVDTSTTAWIFLNIVPGVGLGVLFPALAFAVQASASSESLAIAVAMFSFFRALGQSIGVAVGGVVFQNYMYTNLHKYPTLAPMAREYSKDATGLVQIVKAMPNMEDKAHLQEAYTDSLRVVWAVCCIVCGVALVLSFGTQRYSLDRALESDQGLATCNMINAHEGKGSSGSAS